MKLKSIFAKPPIRNETVGGGAVIPVDNWEQPLRDVLNDNGHGAQTAAMKLSTVNACVEHLSNSMSKMPVHVLNTETKQIERHSLTYLLNERPNEAMTASTYKKLMECNRLLCGNAYAAIMRDKHKRPVELLPLYPAAVTVGFNEAGKLRYTYTHPKTGKWWVLDPFDILHYKAYSRDGINGISVLSRAAEAINIAAAAQIQEYRLWSQGSRPSGILKTEGDLKPEAREKARGEWEALYGGASNSFRVAVLDSSLSYQPISLSNKDTQFVENKETSVQDIARFFGVPLYKLGAGKQSYSSNEQNSIEYIVGTLHPIVEQCDQEDTYKLLFDTERQAYLELKRNLMCELKGDFASRAAMYKSMREIGAYSVNDIRSLEDMPDVPGGESHYASLNYVPLELFVELSKNRNQGGNQ